MKSLVKTTVIGKFTDLGVEQWKRVIKMFYDRDKESVDKRSNPRRDKKGS